MDYGVLQNGRPDPGETVDLVATVKNFGADATNVRVTLDTTDPYIAIIDGSADLGDLAGGQTAATTSDPFSFEVAASAPTGHVVELSLHATFSGGETLSDFQLCIGKFNYLVWDPTSDQSSGPAIAAALDSLHYSGTIRRSLPLDRMDDYATLWVSCGIYADNVVVRSTDPEGPAIVDFMANGGSVYLEGGDTWAFDPQYGGGFDFRPYFGISATVDGTGDLLHVVGVAGAFTAGMDFAYAGENSFIDHLEPSGGAFALLDNSSPAYHCAIARDAGSSRTVGTSFELAGLQDGAEPSTKTALVRAIMDFFEVSPQGDLFADDFESGGSSAWSATVP